MGLRIGSITFNGLASGFPTEDIITQVLALERRPIELLETKKTGFETRLSIFQDLNSKATSLRGILRKLDNMNLVGTDRAPFEEFRKLSASSSDETIATASASSSAVRGNLLVRVDQLAQQERELSQGFLSRQTATGTGTLTIDVGGSGPQAINIDSGNATIEGLVAAINDAGLGATAFIVDDGGTTGTPIHIAVVSNDTGDEGTLVIDASGLSGGAVPTFTEAQTAQDARITLDPGSLAAITISSASNTFSDVITGLTIDVKKADPGTNITIDVRRDDEQIVDGLQELVDAYNEITTLIQEQAQVDPTTNRGGPLIGDSTLTSLKQRLATVISSAIGNSDVTSARQMGLSLNREGTLELDDKVLRATLAASFDDAATFFSGPDSFSDRLRALLDTYVDPVDGLLVARINGTSRSISDLASSIDKAEARLENVEAQLVQQFTALERTISNLQQQGNFLSQFLLANRPA